MQIFKTYSVIPWSHVEVISVGRVLNGLTFGGSWNQEVLALQLLVHIGKVATGPDAESLNTEVV